jgi:hypothetical protein
MSWLPHYGRRPCPVHVHSPQTSHKYGGTLACGFLAVSVTSLPAAGPWPVMLHLQLCDAWYVSSTELFSQLITGILLPTSTVVSLVLSNYRCALADPTGWCMQLNMVSKPEVSSWNPGEHVN